MSLKLTSKKSMSIPEVMLAITIGTVIIGSVLSLWYFTYKTWAVEHIRSKLRVDLEIGIEKMKYDIGLSSATWMSLYPSGAGPYTAVSFPQAVANANGFFTLDANDLIVWDKTVVYHTYLNGSVTELRKTVFDPRNNSLSTAQRYTQLSSVVADGDGAGALNGGNATTTTVLKDVVSLSISPAARQFDGYSPSRTRSDLFDFGSITLVAGNHDITFTITSKNASSSGFGLGVDAFSIAPSGGMREAEIYLPPFASSGDTASKTYVVGWSGDNFLDFSSNAVNDYVTLRFYYDMWQESNFDNAILDNLILTGNDLYIKLPDLTEGNVIDWQAVMEAGSDSAGEATKADYDDNGGVAITVSDITVRSILSNGNIDIDANLIRVMLEAHSDPNATPLVITAAYIDERDPLTNNQNAVNPNTSTSRIQLYFTDALGVVSAGLTIPDPNDGAASTVAYSNWAIFDIDSSKDYFITFYIQTGDISYWAGTDPTEDNSYLMKTDESSTEVWPGADLQLAIDPPGTELPTVDDTWTSTPHIYVTATMEGWTNAGSVTSHIYDTKVDNPVYNLIAWDESEPTGTAILFKARSSDDANMTGATDWASIGGSSSNPSSLSIGSGRYVQFRGELSSVPYWTCIDHSGVSVADADYKANPVNRRCPTDTMPLLPALNTPWIDNVEIDWPGETHVCDVSAYMTMDSDYGIVKVSIDGADLLKALQFTLTLSDVLLDVTYQEALTAEIEPKNTGN